MSSPGGAEGRSAGRSLAAHEGRAPNDRGLTWDMGGNVILTRSPSPQTIDLVKRGVDDVLEGYRDRTSGRLNLDEGGRAVEGLRQRYLGEADRLYPDTYPQDRAAFAGPA